MYIKIAFHALKLLWKHIQGLFDSALDLELPRETQMQYNEQIVSKLKVFT